MKRTKLRLAVVTLATLGVAAVATPASATHSHHLITPGTCVDKNGAGFGTGQEHADPSFHTRFHTGQPGKVFARDGQPVAVVGGSVCP